MHGFAGMKELAYTVVAAIVAFFGFSSFYGFVASINN